MELGHATRDFDEIKFLIFDPILIRYRDLLFGLLSEAREKSLRGLSWCIEWAWQLDIVCCAQKVPQWVILVTVVGQCCDVLGLQVTQELSWTSWISVNAWMSFALSFYSVNQPGKPFLDLPERKGCCPFHDWCQGAGLNASPFQHQHPTHGQLLIFVSWKCPWQHFSKS